MGRVVLRLLTFTTLCSSLTFVRPLAAAPAAKVSSERQRVIPGVGRIRLHKVYRGQRLGTIAKRYRIPVEALTAANDITSSTRIKPGHWLVIPPPKDRDGDETAKRRAHVLGDRAAPVPPEEGAVTPTAPNAPKAPTKTKPAAAAKIQVHVVYRGQTAQAIARRYQISVDALLGANDLEAADPLHPKQKLLIPPKSDEDGSRTRARRDELLDSGDPEQKKLESKRARVRQRLRRADVVRSYKSYMRPARRRGYLKVEHKGRSFQGYVLGRRGKLLRGYEQLKALVGADQVQGGLPVRLVRLLVKASDAFGGRELRVVSGYRTRSYASHSRHFRGHAIDFSIPGVPNEALRDYLLTFDGVGVGYYPNSSFVHFDVRTHKTYWVDASGPGEAPRYTYRGPDKPKAAP